MKRSLSAILEELKKSPADWTIRIDAIEAALRLGDRELAKQLVREDPSKGPLPAEIQVRLHTFLTQGVQEESEEESDEGVPDTPEAGNSAPVETAATVERSAPAEADVAEAKKENPSRISVVPPERQRKIEVVAAESREAPASSNTSPDDYVPIPIDSVKKKRSDEEDTDGGMTALLEMESAQESAGLARTLRRKKNKGSAPTIDFHSAIDRWANYEGDLELVDAGYIPPAKRSFTNERLSSLSMAIFVHVLLFFLIGLVAVSVPLPKPPQLIVSAVQEREAEWVAPPMVKQSIEIKPAAAAARSLDVITSVENSSFSLPDVDEMDNELVAALLPGIQPSGNGMSFSTEATEASNINFFGISGGGKKIVFIIDATPKMLVDEKGGMFAYDNVKNEVGAMLANFNRGTHFNILLYEGKRLVPFRDDMVPGLPSNLRLAIEWLDPLNRNYDRLGLSNNWGAGLEVEDSEAIPLKSADVAHYTKAIQKSMEWGASTIFCIASGYERMSRSPTEEMRKMMAENPPTPGTPGTIDPGEAKAWRQAVEKTREWLKNENAARLEKGLSPKVVIDFNGLVRQRTGATPPRRTGGTPATGGANVPRLPPIGPEDIEEHFEKYVKINYTKPGYEEPSVHLVLFLGEDEKIENAEDHFRRLTRQNRGKLKVLRGLAALDDVTGDQ